MNVQWRASVMLGHDGEAENVAKLWFRRRRCSRPRMESSP
jgi:hypothetical protein